MTKHDVEKTYRKWWIGRKLTDGSTIIDLTFHSSPSGFSGVVTFTVYDGKQRKEVTATMTPSEYKPTKKTVERMLLPKNEEGTNSK